MSVQMEFKSDDVGFFKRFSFLRATSRWIDTITPEIETTIAEHAPVRTGRLRDSIRHRKSFGFSGVAVEFGSNVPYAEYVERGTPPHIIRARNAKYLRFQSRGGNIVYAKSVNHPGTKANPFSQRAVEELLPTIQDLFEEEVENQFRKA